jgi:CTP synthase (UTP-ammonia lyase)
MSAERSDVSIALIAEYNPLFPPHPATNAALSHSADRLGITVRGDWLSTENLTTAALAGYDALWIGPGSPYKSLQNTLDAIRFARERGVPCLGTCGGFQHIVIEYARNVLGHKDAQHAEYDPYASTLFISALACSLASRQMTIRLVAGSRVAACYGALRARENYYCNFGVNPAVVPLFQRGALRIVGSDDEGEIRVLELPEHPFFVATLYVPQNHSRPGSPHPLVTSFLQAAHAARRGATAA